MHRKDLKGGEKGTWGFGSARCALLHITAHTRSQSASLSSWQEDNEESYQIHTLYQLGKDRRDQRPLRTAD